MGSSDPRTVGLSRPSGAGLSSGALQFRSASACISLQGTVARIVVIGLILVFVAPLKAQTQTPAPAQSPAPAPAPAPSPATDAPQGKTEGNYVIQQSVEAGYRDSMIGGNLNNYDTFENLSSGMRLFDYTVDMHSINHNGVFFDDLSFSNFGYGGDPNDVSRLHVVKNKWFDFRGMFRRDKNYWNYNLLANPLNPASSNPAVPIVNSPQALNLSRRMQDYDLTLFPQSRLRFRMGYSHNSNEGPASATVEGGTEPSLVSNDSRTHEFLPVRR